MTILIIDNNDDSINDDDDDDDGYLCELLLIFLRANLIPYADFIIQLDHYYIHVAYVDDNL